MKRVLSGILVMCMLIFVGFGFTACNLSGDTAGISVPGAKGDKGDPGKNGTTPHIGDNGNWWIGTTDTGVAAAGEDGTNGEDGKDGKDGKDGTGSGSELVKGEITSIYMSNIQDTLILTIKIEKPLQSTIAFLNVHTVILGKSGTMYRFATNLWIPIEIDILTEHHESILYNKVAFSAGVGYMFNLTTFNTQSVLCSTGGTATPDNQPIYVSVNIQGLDVSDFDTHPSLHETEVSYYTII